MMPIRTERLELVPASLAHIDADMESPESLGKLLGAAVPASWPPGEYDRSAMEFFRARLMENDAAVGWYGWYAIHRPIEGHGSVVIGAGGYLGPPDSDGVVEVGYSIAPEFQARAFATELVQALVLRAFSVPGVVRVIAHTNAGNAGSIKVLERCGFTPAGAGSEPDTLRYERLRPDIDNFQLSYRNAVHSDVHEIADLVNSAYRGESSKLGWTNEAAMFEGQRTDAEEIFRLVDADDSLILLCLHGSHIVGSVHLEKSEGGAYLGMLAISPALQGAGIGKQFMEEAELAACKTWGCRKISMTVITQRHELIAFYERRGYRRTGRVEPLPTDSRAGIPRVADLQIEWLEKAIRSSARQNS